MERCACGREIRQSARGGARRLRCEVCSPPKPRNDVVSIAAPESRSAESLADTVRQAIIQSGRANTVDGAAAIFAAEMLIAGGSTAASAAALLKEMRAAAADALKNVAESGDLVDDLKKRRADRRGA